VRRLAVWAVYGFGAFVIGAWCLMAWAAMTGGLNP
jgi:hypothetical protein